MMSGIRKDVVPPKSCAGGWAASSPQPGASSSWEAWQVVWWLLFW